MQNHFSLSLSLPRRNGSTSDRLCDSQNSHSESPRRVTLLLLKRACYSRLCGMRAINRSTPRRSLGHEQWLSSSRREVSSCNTVRGGQILHGDLHFPLPTALCLGCTTATPVGDGCSLLMRHLLRGDPLARHPTFPHRSSGVTSLHLTWAVGITNHEDGRVQCRRRSCVKYTLASVLE